MLTETGRPCPQGTAVVIEDDLDIRNLMSAVLRQAGFDVYSAANGRDGVKFMHSTIPAVVTIDIGLPDINGYEVLRRIRDVSDCHVIMVSARTAESYVTTASQCGADDYLIKPFRPHELRARVDAVLQRLHTETEAGDGAASSRACARVSIPTGRVIRRSWPSMRKTGEWPESLATARLGLTVVASIQVA